MAIRNTLGTSTNEQAIARRRQMAEALMQQGQQTTQAPPEWAGMRVQPRLSIGQALAGVGQQLAGAYGVRKADEAAATAEQQKRDKIASALRGLTTPPQSMPSSQPPGVPGSPSLPAPAAAAGAPDPRREAALGAIQSLPIEVQQQIAAQMGMGALAPPAPPEEYTLAPGQQRRRGSEIIAENPAAAGGTDGDPANVREWNFYSRLDPEQQRAYREMKRNNYGIVDVGGVPSIVEKGPQGSRTPLSTLDTEVGAAGAKAQAGAVGKAQGERAVADVADEGRLTVSADDTLKVIDDLASHPGLSAAVGVKGITNYLPATDAAGFKAKFGQLSGKTFLEAINGLRGTGQITEKEGQEAKAAVAALDTTQSEEEFRKNLATYRAVVARGADRARQAASRGRAVLGGAQPAAGPKVGEVVDGYRFKGGNAGDPASWERVP